MIEFADLSAVDMLRAFRSRELSPVEVTDAVIQRIALWEPSLKALYAYDPEGARAAAKESEGRWRRPSVWLSALAGSEFIWLIPSRSVHLLVLLHQLAPLCRASGARRR